MSILRFSIHLLLQKYSIKILFDTIILFKSGKIVFGYLDISIANA